MEETILRLTVGNGDNGSNQGDNQGQNDNQGQQGNNGDQNEQQNQNEQQGQTGGSSQQNNETQQSQSGLNVPNTGFMGGISAHGVETFFFGFALVVAISILIT